MSFHRLNGLRAGAHDLSHAGMAETHDLADHTEAHPFADGGTDRGVAPISGRRVVADRSSEGGFGLGHHMDCKEMLTGGQVESKVASMPTHKPAPLYSTQAFDAFIRLSDNCIVYKPKAGSQPLVGKHSYP